MRRNLEQLRSEVGEKLRFHLATVKAQHEADLALGAGAVVLPEALARKYPSAAREWIWQWVFPATRTYTDPATGDVRRHHLHETVIQRAVRKAAIAAGITKPVTRRQRRAQPPRPLIAIARLRGESALSDIRPRPRSQRALVSTRDHEHWKLNSVDECVAPSAGIMISFAG